MSEQGGIDWNVLLPKAPWYDRFLPKSWRRRRNARRRNNAVDNMLAITPPRAENTELYMRMYQGGMAPQLTPHWQTAAIEPHPGVTITDAYGAASVELPRYAEFGRYDGDLPW